MSETVFPARTTMQESQLGTTHRPNLGLNGQIPCTTEDEETGQWLMLAFTNADPSRAR